MFVFRLILGRKTIIEECIVTHGEENLEVKEVSADGSIRFIWIVWNT